MRNIVLISSLFIAAIPAFAQSLSSTDDNTPPSPYAQQVQQAFNQADVKARQQFEKNYPKPTAPVITKTPAAPTPEPTPAPRTYTPPPPVDAAPPPAPRTPDVTAAPNNNEPKHNIYLPPKPQN